MNSNPISYLEYWAKLKPKQNAIASNKLVISYKKLNDLSKRISCKLEKLGIKQSSTVITCFSRKDIEWILTLAIVRLGSNSGSNHGYAHLNELTELDWVITDKPVDFHNKSQVILIDSIWLNNAAKVFDDEIFFKHPNQINSRFCLTSGTTGIPKRVYRTYDRVISSARAQCCTNPHYSTTLELMKLSAGGGFTQAISTLISGSTLYCSDNPKNVYELIKKYQIKCLSGSPAQIGRLISHIHQSQKDSLNLDLVKYGGSQASLKLIQNIRQYLSKNIYTTYGSTEAGGIAGMYIDQRFQSNMVGYINPGVKVEVLDGEEPVLNQVGIIRIKSPMMTSEYYKNPKASQDTFRNGWFYPGDRGVITDEGLLSVTGREKELINRGGIKIDPAKIDNSLVNHDQIIDGATFSFEDHLGVVHLAAAIVPETTTINMNEIYTYLLKLHGKSRTPQYYLRVQAIPKNHMGKVMREDLKKKLEPILIKKLTSKSEQ